MGKEQISIRVDQRLLRELELYKKRYPSRNAIIERSMERYLLFLKKNSLSRK
jgi:metal-responsive CopG/Arc/MetJ family transcriptional regulator